MKRILLIALTAGALLFTGCTKEEAAPKAAAKPMNYQAVPASKAQMLQDGKGKMFCPVCGMTLPMFYKTNHAADIDGETHQYCSVHCMVEESEMKGKPLSNVKVVDNSTMKFIDAKEAVYVVGSKMPGTMSGISKYAFGTKKAAEDFAAANGGEIKSYSEVYAMVKAGLKKEIEMIKARQAKAAKMGGQIYAKMCKQTDKRFTSPAEAKSFVVENGLCGNLKGKELQMVSLYLSGK